MRKKGVFLIILRNRKVLLLKRKDNNKYSFPAGKVKRFETCKRAAKRELFEEIGLRVNTRQLILDRQINFRIKNKIHHIGYFYIVKNYSGKPLLKEPYNHSLLKWFNKKKLPKNITEHCALVLNSVKKRRRLNFNYK